MEKTVVTGMGVFSTAGYNLDDFWDCLYQGKNTYHEIEEFKQSKEFRTCIGARIPEKDYEREISGEIRSRHGKAAAYTIHAASSALAGAGLEKTSLPKHRVAVCIGSTMGEIQVEEAMSRNQADSGREAIPPNLANQYNTNHIGSALTEIIPFPGPVYSLSSACAAGNYAISIGKHLIEWDEADIAVVGGVDVFSRVAFCGFQRLLSLAPRVCQPFDQNRKGLIVGEGCGVIVLERETFASERGVTPLCEVAGVGLSSDRFHMTSPHLKADGAMRSMHAALKEAGLDTGEIDYISGHGTGTMLNDKIELEAIGKLWNGKVPPISSIKSMLGHSMGAASALEFISSVLTCQNKMLLPTMNFETPDPNYDFNFVANEAQPAAVTHVLSNSYGFGGQASSVILKGVAS